jgi:hypothetical protein
MKVTEEMVFATRMLMLKYNINNYQMLSVLAAMEKENKKCET